MKIAAISAIFAALSLTACARSSVTPVSGNEFVLSVSAAPACSNASAAEVASQMAAVETLRRGYTHFIILGMRQDDSVRVTHSAPTHAYTTGTVRAYGNTAYGSSTTTYGGAMPVYSGSRDAALMVRMMKPGDPGFDNSINAKQALGPDWEAAVKSGKKTCI